MRMKKPNEKLSISRKVNTVSYNSHLKLLHSVTGRGQ
jgi:hypothetical protein